MLRSMLLAFACSCSLTACGGSQNLQWAYQANDRQDYESALQDWTRKGEKFDRITQQLLVYATLHSPRFAGAQARWEAQNEGLQGQALQQKIDDRVAQAEGELRFFIAVSTYDSLWNDLDSPEPSLKLFLRCGDEELTPSSIQHLNSDQMADARIAYPYTGQLLKGYHVIFPKPSTQGDLNLRLAGAPGQVVLNWNIR